MKILLIQENGRHEKNKNFRECFCLQRAFIKLNHDCDVWGLGHSNFNEKINFNEYDLIINLENYGNGWEPNLSEIKSKKFLWSIDAHSKGEQPFNIEFERGKYDLLLHSTKDFVNQDYKIWFPNAFDDTLIYPKKIEKKCDVGFCGSMLNRKLILDILSKKYNFIHDNFVIGDNMVDAINSYKIHWNKNIANDINYRNFETLGCGIPLVTNYNHQYDELGFINMENVVFYNNDEEMYSSLQLLLDDEELRLRIANNGFELSKQHTYEKRCEFLINLYNKL
jgi:hypothetical protein